MNARSRLLIIAASILAVLALALGGAAFYLQANPLVLSGYRDEIAAELNAATGRTIKITGKITLGVSLTPTLDVEGLQIANLQWGKAANFVTIGEAGIRVRLIPLLRGRTEIESITADHAIVHLETDGDARRNWNVLAQAATPEGEEAAIPVIDEIKVGDIMIDYRDIGDATVRYRLHLEDAALTNDAVNGIGSFKVAGKLDENSFKAEGKIAPLYTVSPEQPRQFDLKAEIFDMNLSADGSVKFPFKEFTYADFKLHAPNGLARVADYFDVKIPDAGAFEVEGNLTPFGDELHFGNLTASSGDSDAAGFVILKPGQPLGVTADLRSKILDLKPYFAGDDTPPLAADPRKIFPRDSLVFQFPGRIDLKLRHSVAALKTRDEEFSNLALEAQLNSASLWIYRLDFDLAGGRVSNRVSIKPLGQSLAVSMNSQAIDVDLATLFKKYDLPKYAKGKALMLFEGDSTGASLAELAAGLNGRVYFDISNGAIPMRLSSLLGGGVGNLFRSLENMFDGTGSDSAIQCGFAGFSIDGGVAKNKALLLITDKAVMPGRGSIDLRTERLNLRLSPRPRDLSLVNIATDVNIKGALAAPEIHLDKGDVAKKVGKTALGVALGPLGLILGAAGSVISHGNDPAAGSQCRTTRAAVYEALQATAPWPALRELGAENR